MFFRPKHYYSTLFFSVILCVISLSGCSAIFGGDTITLEQKQAVLRVVNEYLSFVALGKRDQAESMILWVDYVEQGGPGFNREIFRKQFAIAQAKKWDPKSHPLYNLDLTDLAIDDERAAVRLSKYQNEKSPVIAVDLVWAGRGWLVTGDTLFGMNGLFNKLPSSS